MSQSVASARTTFAKSANQGYKNKKSELMLMRCARVYGSYCLHVILVYLHPLRRNSLFCSQKSPKNHTKSIFLGFKVIQGH